MSQFEWTAARVFAATTPEATSTVQAATFVSMEGTAKTVEIRLRWGTDTSPLTTGATNPTGVTLAVWRKGNVGGTERVDKLGTIFASVSSNVVLNRETVVFENVNAEKIYVSAEGFVAGTVPALTGTVDFRVLA
jgi:hypothetical protein